MSSSERNTKIDADPIIGNPRKYSIGDKVVVIKNYRAKVGRDWAGEKGRIVEEVSDKVIGDTGDYLVEFGCGGRVYFKEGSLDRDV